MASFTHCPDSDSELPVVAFSMCLLGTVIQSLSSLGAGELRVEITGGSSTCVTVNY